MIFNAYLLVKITNEREDWDGTMDFKNAARGLILGSQCQILFAPEEFA
jgi:hypothetical protein